MGIPSNKITDYNHQSNVMNERERVLENVLRTFERQKGGSEGKEPFSTGNSMTDSKDSTHDARSNAWTTSV